MTGVILSTINEKTIYHVDYTRLYSDLKMIGELNDIEVAFIQIANNFTMGPDDAVIAADWIGANIVVPIHYNTFPVIEQDPEDFAKRVKTGEGKAMKVGDVLEL